MSTDTTTDTAAETATLDRVIAERDALWTFAEQVQALIPPDRPSFKDLMIDPEWLRPLLTLLPERT